MEQHHLLGQFFALAAAATWALAMVLFKRSGETVSPLALNLFKNFIGIALTAGTVGAMLLAPVLFPTDGTWLKLPEHPGDVCILLLSGIIGIAIADTIFFYALNLIGVGLFTIVDCIYAPLVILFSWLLLVEQLAWCHYLGGGLILAGVFVSTRHAPPPDRTHRQILWGMLLAGSAVAMVAFAIVLAKPVLEKCDAVSAALLRLLAGTVILALLTVLLPEGRKLWGVFRPARVWRQSVPAAVLGTYLSMIFWVAGFKYARAAVAAILNQTSVLFALLLATFILRERLTVRKLLAVALAIPGVALITLADDIGPPLRAWVTRLWTG
ncbi:MAG TPA: DMT family transporter [Phycisphaerae bacterium]|nr:DMT family transporter [Phycisphaerae bacterium]HNU46548.1 DMT family transporter [Phycisphaerae bacterium]